MRISDWSSDVCSSDLTTAKCRRHLRRLSAREEIAYDEAAATGELCPPLRHVEIETAAKIAVDALKSEASQDGVQRGGEFLAIAGDGYKVTLTHQMIEIGVNSRTRSMLPLSRRAPDCTQPGAPNGTTLNT